MNKDYERHNKYLEENLDSPRMAHSQGTASEAVSLARIYGADENKAYVAGLLHDVAKGKCAKGLDKLAARYNVEIDEVEKINPELLHGKLGALMVKEQLGIEDDDILSAICWHTTGRAGMSLLEKIVYIADLIEPGRHFEGLDAIRSLAYKDIDLAMQLALKQVSRFVQSKGFVLHPKSIEAYNDIINKKENTSLTHHTKEEAIEVAKQLYAKKAEDVRVLHVAHMTILADYFILASGRSDVHVKALSDDIQKYLADNGRERLRIEGYREGRWIVLDYGDILIHIFHKQEREFYGLERLWVDNDNCTVITDEDMKKI